MSAATGEGGIGGVSFLSTHPANAKRIKVSVSFPDVSVQSGVSQN